jgi:hypothetical protein
MIKMMMIIIIIIIQTTAKRPVTETAEERKENT